VAPGDGVGLRGGTFSATKSGDGYRLTLKNMRWTEDLAVSGTVDLPRYQGTAKAHLQLRAAQGWSGTLEAQWTEGTALARAQVHGQLDGQQLAAVLPAP